MKFFAIGLIILLSSSSKSKKTEQNNRVDSLPNSVIKDTAKYSFDEKRWETFRDSMIARADKPVEDDIQAYKHLFTKKEIVDETLHLSYSSISFHTGDAAWDNQLNSKLAGLMKVKRKEWIEGDYEYARTDTSKESKEMWENINQRHELTPLFVTKRWLTAEYFKEGYYGGARGDWMRNYLHFYKDEKGKLKQLKQPEIFIYDKDSSINRNFYNLILKCMESEMKCDSLNFYDSCAFMRFDKYRISMELFTRESEYEYDPYFFKFYLIPTKSGLKTKHYYSTLSDGESKAPYQPDIIIPYKSLKGIINEKYLKLWME